MATLISSLMDSWLTRLRAVVRKRCTSTWSLSATSILASPPPPVSLRQPSISASNIALTIHNRSFDLQVRRYRQAYHREVREGKNSTPLLPLHINFHLIAIFLPLGGVEIRFPQSAKFCARTLLARQRALVAAQQSISLLHRINFSCSAADSFYRKPPSWARVLSSMRGFLTS